MTELTEQWKKGELPEGFYYIKVKEVIANYPLLADCVEGLSYTYFLDYEDYVTEVLAPVPSYEEWKNFENANTNLFDAVKMLVKDNFLLEKQNAQLKETNEALEVELKEVCDVLIRKCPEMKEWVMMNWKNLYEVQDDKKA